MCGLLEQFSGTEHAAVVNKLESAVKKQDKSEIKSILVLLGNEGVNKVNALFEQLQAGEERQKAGQ